VKNVIHITALIVVIILSSSGSFAQDSQSAAPEATAPLLTVDEAIALALSNNRLVKNSLLETQKSDFQIHAVATRRRPQFNVSVLGGMLLNPIDFTFPAGLFGVFPGIGPFPPTQATITTPRRPSVLSMGTINQPLTQQYKIGLGIRAQELGRGIARENVRLERQEVEANVRKAYFELIAIQSGADAARQGVTALRNAKAVAERYAAERAILSADLLEIEARLAKQEYQLAVTEDGLATQREHLNQLMGREISAEFRVSSTPETLPIALSLDSARQRAIANRPEIQQAILKQQQAEYAKRIAKAGAIPDVSFNVSYFGVANVDFAPGNYAIAGIYLSWEPFDWRRRRDEVEEKSLTITQAKNGVAETESQITVEVGMRFRKWRETLLLMKSSALSHQARAEQLRVVSNKFKEDAALLKDVLQIQAQSAEADYQYQECLSQYWSALADLRKAMGE
jgi:outer membrane protein TolC